MKKGMRFKIQIRSNCLICNGVITVNRFRTFCSKKCRDRASNIKYADMHAEWQRKRNDAVNSKPSKNKVKCLDCGRYYVQVGSHVIARHGYETAREYREQNGLDVKKGTVPTWYRKMKGEQAIENETYKNIIFSGAPFRFKKGQFGPGQYNRSEETIARLKNLSRVHKKNICYRGDKK